MAGKVNESQRGMVGAKLANLQRGAPEGNNNASKGEKSNSAIAPFVTQKQAAEMLNIGKL
jgi:hypothetical protein